MVAMRISHLTECFLSEAQSLLRGLATQYEFMLLTEDNECLSLENFEENVMVFGFLVQNT